jgi:nucleolin
MADGRSRGFAHIEFASIADATSVVEASKTSSFKILDRELKVDYAPPRFQHTPEPYHVLYVSEFVGNEEELRSAMKDYGSSITKVTLSSFFSLLSLASS